MNPEHEAWLKWQASAKGKAAVVAATLGPTPAANTYLENRFREVFCYAFYAGEQEGLGLAKLRLGKVIDGR